MKKLLQISFFCFINICYSQTKEELIKTIEKANIVESDCVGSVCKEGEQYLNFKKLRKKLSEKELTDLTKYKKPVLRSYAYRELIQSNNTNVIDFFIYELNKNQKVPTFEGCIQDEELISSIVYHEYWNKIRIESLEQVANNDEKAQDIAMQKQLESDYVIEKLDSIIIHSDKHVYWLLYSRAFNNRKHKDIYLPRIEKLAFDQNNAYALFYIEKYYPTQSKEKIKSYFENKFQKVSFKSERDFEYFEELIEFLLDSNNKEFIKIAVEKLRKDRTVWKNINHRIINMLEEHNTKL